MAEEKIYILPLKGNPFEKLVDQTYGMPKLPVKSDTHQNLNLSQ